MTVLSSTNTSREGNDCYIYEEIALVSQFEMYAVIRSLRVTGWATREDMDILLVTTDKAEAGKKYKEYCKYYKA